MTPEMPSLVEVDPFEEETIKKFAAIIAVGLGPEAICLGLIADIDNCSQDTPRESITRERYIQHFEERIETRTRAGAIAVQAGNWSAAAMWEPPNFSIDTEPASRQCSLLKEWKIKIAKLEAEHLGPQTVEGTGDCEQGMVKDAKTGKVKLRPYWHLSYLVRNPDIPHVPGAVSGVVRPFMQRACEDGVPAWLEATTPHAVSIYEHYGFRVVAKVTIGSGRFDVDGWPKSGGQGISVWVMIFDQHLKTSKTKPSANSVSPLLVSDS